MTIVHSRNSVRDFYTRALESGRRTAEDLHAPVAECFTALVSSLPHDMPRTALDIGYGAGHHTMWLAGSGFSVTAVDQVPRRILEARLQAFPALAGRIEIRESLVETCRLDQEVGFLLARNVLHFLSQGAGEALLARAVTLSRSGSVHYLEVFSDITRVSAEGRPIRIEGEAAYALDDFHRAMSRTYTGWDLRFHDEEHVERHPVTSHVYFRAIRTTVVARRTPDGAGDGNGGRSA